MSVAAEKQTVNVEFIRLFFHAPVEEEIAFRWASRLRNLIGSHVLQLRPTTTLAEIADWASTQRIDPMDFVVVFEPELRRQFSVLLEDAEEATFREMVQYAAEWYPTSL